MEPAESKNIKKLNLSKCYHTAWRSFAKWWIPICLLSAVIFTFQIVPRILVNEDIKELRTTAKETITALKEQDRDKLEAISIRVQNQTKALIQKFTAFWIYTIPFTALFTVILLMYANWAVKNKKEKRKSLLTLIYIAVVHVILAIGKMTLSFLILPLGAYVYVKLFFVSLIMIEGEKNALEAIATSWRTTTGNFWPLFLVVVINFSIQIVSSFTIVGLIPATGFVNTARAAAFRMLWEENM
jgi:hypothetical protein